MKWYFVFLVVLLITGLIMLPSAVSSFTSSLKVGLQNVRLLHSYSVYSHILGGGDPIDTPADVA